MAGKKRKIVNTYDIVAAMNNDQLISQCVMYNELANAPYVCGELPWDYSRTERPWNDFDMSNLYAYLQQEANIGRAKAELSEAFNVFLTEPEHRYHPVRVWLDSLKWDGTQRVSTMLTDCLGAEPTTLNAQFMWLTMMGAIVRAFHPGTKFDYMLTLQGHQGKQKSTFVSRLAMCDNWYLECIGDMTNPKMFGEQVAGKWIAEIAELDGLQGADVNKIKAVITRRTDRYRASYGKVALDYPRQLVMIGTCNDATMLTDATGNRRFLIVECGLREPNHLPSELPRQYFDQAWAEVYEAIKRTRLSGEAPMLYLTSAQEAEAEEVRSSYMVNGDTIAKIREWLITRQSIAVCASMVVEECLGIERTNARYKTECREVTKILDNQCKGWMRVRNKRHKARCGNYGTVLAWKYYGE